MVGGDLLDVHRRREFVERKIVGIEHGEAVPRGEPYFTVWGLADFRTCHRYGDITPYAIESAKNRELDRAIRLTVPGLRLGVPNAHQSAGHGQPQGMVVIFYRPMDFVARQPVLAAQRGSMSVFQAAQPALGRGPQRSVSVDAQVADRAFSKAV